MPGSDLALICEAAEDAGRVALGFWRGAFRHWDKDAGAGPVSEADLAVNARLADLLKPRRPDYGWLSEEGPADPGRMSARRCLIVDPIDGTRAFIEGNEGFSVCIAVVEDGRPIAGVVHLPVPGLTYAAEVGGPATLNGTPIRAPEAPLTDATVLTTKAALASEHWRDGRVPPLRRHFRSSLAWRLCLVAEGRFDSVLSVRPVWDWDIAAASLIAAQAGCTVSDAGGRPFRFNGPQARGNGLIVAPPRLHDALARAIVPPTAVP